MVYIVLVESEAGDQAIKIGTAHDVEARVRDLGGSVPFLRITVLASLPGGIARERELQRRWKEHRWPGRSHALEWFIADEEMLRWARELSNGPEGQDVIEVCGRRVAAAVGGARRDEVDPAIEDGVRTSGGEGEVWPWEPPPARPAMVPIGKGCGRNNRRREFALPVTEDVSGDCWGSDALGDVVSGPGTLTQLGARRGV
jgi:hypothetical protein